MPTTYNLTLRSFTWETGFVGVAGGESEVAIDGDQSTYIYVGSKFYLRAVNTEAGQIYESSTILRTCTAVAVITIAGSPATEVTFTPVSAVGVWTTRANLVLQISAIPTVPPAEQFFSGNPTALARDDQLYATVIAAQG